MVAIGSMEAETTDRVCQVVALVRGRVQGVGFRYFVRTAALRLNINGWVRNEPDGSVKVVAEGPTQKLRHLINALYTGPSLASVRSVELDWRDTTEDFPNFAILL